MKQTIPLGISACVNGEAVRFNAGNAKMPAFLKAMEQDFSFLPFCPEVAAGMGVPREAVRLVSSDVEPGHRLVAVNSGQDWTGRLNETVENYVGGLSGRQLRGYVVKSKSPSCGSGSAKIYNKHRFVEGKGDGLFTRQLKQSLLIPVVEAEQLNSPLVADRFLHQVMLADEFYRLPQDLQGRHLIDLYARYKLLIMAYSPSHYRQAGRLLANLADRDLARVRDALYLLLFDALGHYSCRKRQTNALMHVQGYFKKYLPAVLKREFGQLLDAYYKAQLPLSVPMTMIRHYLLQYPNSYLQSQKYLAPYPDDYGLRNHL